MKLILLPLTSTKGKYCIREDFKVFVFLEISGIEETRERENGFYKLVAFVCVCCDIIINQKRKIAENSKLTKMW